MQHEFDVYNVIESICNQRRPDSVTIVLAKPDTFGNLGFYLIYIVVFSFVM